MAYSYRLYSTIGDVDPDVWNAVQQFDPTPFSDLRYLRIIEQTMGDVSRCWPLVITDQDDHPAAIACLSLFQVDGSILAGPILRTVASRMRKLRPRFLRLPMLILGLPVSTGHSPVVVRPGVEAAAIQDALLRAVDELEQQTSPSLTLAKEFDDRQAAELRGLVQEGFLEVNNIPMHDFPVIFDDFDDYLRQRSGRHRGDIRRSRRKLSNAGIQIKHLRGDEGALDCLTEEAHRLYVAVYERSDTKFEFYPLEYFRDVARQFPEESWFMFLTQKDRLVAFSFRLEYRNCVHVMFLGLDYSINRQVDLYFNILYEELDWSLSRRPESIYFGQNGETVKSRIGCGQSRRTMFVRGRRLWHPLIKSFSSRVFPSGDVQESRLVCDVKSRARKTTAASASASSGN